VSGQLDWAGNDIPNVYRQLRQTSTRSPTTRGLRRASTVTLWFNLNPGNGGATGIGDPAVRKAVSYGVDRNALAQLASRATSSPRAHPAHSSCRTRARSCPLTAP